MTASRCTARPTCWPLAGWRITCVKKNTATSPISTSTGTSIRQTYVSRIASSAPLAAPRAPGAYSYSLEEIYARAEQGVREGALEFHLVGGLHPDLPFEYFLEMIRGLKQRCPGVHLKAFTMVEVGYFARIAKLSTRETLVKLKEAGVDSLPGGGAEIFHPRVRRIICDHKVSGQMWLNIARQAHEIGLR